LFSDPLDPAYAQAAAARAEHGPLPSWRRLSRGAGAAATMLIIGVLLAVAYQQVVAGAPGREKVRNALIADIVDRQKRTDELTTTVEKLQGEVSGLREAALTDTAVAALREIEGATGMRKVTGDGVVVRLSDGPNAGTDNKARVLDYDLQQITNQLWASGAEAITINGQRLTGTTPIRTAGAAILVGSAPILGPYEVWAIGPANMVSTFNDSRTGGFYRSMRDDPILKIGFSVEQRDGLVLPAAQLPELQYATVPAPSASQSTKSSPTPSGSPSGGGK
jgi:uncharacterized protein YlxW (UPF0749 family)